MSNGADDWGGGGGADWGGGASSSGGDSYSETTSQSWFARVKNALIGIPIGVILFLASFVVLFWNEGRSVKTARSLAEGKAAVVSVEPDRVDSAHEGKLVHVSGPVTVDQTLKDPVFGVSAAAVRLQRVVQMYQWQERAETSRRKKLGGGEEQTTTYTYSREWSASPIDSSRFKHPEGHQNPGAFPFPDWSADAEVVKLGAFRLPASLVSQIKDSEPLAVGDAERDALPPDLRDRVKVDQGRFYLGEDPGNPRVGDVTVEFRQVRPTTVSLLARQSGDTFQPYQTRAGDTINRLQAGTATAGEMFQAAEAENSLTTWLLRLVGFVLMAVGVGLVLGPLAVLSDVVPFVGDIVRFGTGFVALGVALPLSLVTIALGWIAYRPVVGVTVLLVAGLAFAGFLSLARGRRQAARTP